ncbi:DUF5723 family protein [Arenibacter certesii]|uniref:DUF5723 domain-containing protein n=1 Tax=Arenibacter certesii TaxID=228955 RepID=A0A918IQU6_9FLAO|nr:DUF5723 family protein [Arenibacter certesii]GGW23901.1 hypothetical protein GCM10007383_05440 [Arenibacter certesii]
MRLILVFLLVYLSICAQLSAQNKQLLYDFTDIPDALMVNPGMLTDFEWYVGLPIISGVSVQAGSNAITVHDLFAADGLDFNDKVMDRMIYKLDENDHLSSTNQITLFNGGFRGRNLNDFYSFGIYSETDGIGYYFKDYAILAIEGDSIQSPRSFNLNHLNTRAEMVNVFHFGINRKIDKKLTVGARAKIYSSVLNFTSTENKGHFITTEGERNLVANTLDADLEVKTSGLNNIVDAWENDRSQLPGIVARRMFFGGDLGFGADFGFTYHLNKKTVITGSILDLGFVYNSTDVKNYTLKGSATIEGIEAILPVAPSDADKDYWQVLVDDINEMVPYSTNNDSYITFRPTKLYGSLRYNFGKPIPSRRGYDCKDYVREGRGYDSYNNALGGQLYVVNRPKGPQAALTAFYLHRFGNAMAIKTTYTVDKFSYSNIGVGLNLQAGPVNLYLMADNLLAYNNLADSHYASFQFGLNIISWGKK